MQPHGKPVFKTIHVPYIYKVFRKDTPTHHKDFQGLHEDEFAFIKGRRVFAFSGIANNDDFRRTVENFGCDIIEFLNFRDHERYSDKDLDFISNSAVQTGADFLLTTEKDYARISQKITWPIDLVVVGIKISFGDNGTAFNAFIKSRLEEIEKVKRRVGS